MPRKTGPDSSLSSHARRKRCVRGQTGPSEGRRTKADRADMIWLVYPVNNALSTDKSEPRRRTPLRCWHCRQPGHVRRECLALQQLIRCRVSRIVRIQNEYNYKKS